MTDRILYQDYASPPAVPPPSMASWYRSFIDPVRLRPFVFATIVASGLTYVGEPIAAADTTDVEFAGTLVTRVDPPKGIPAPTHSPSFIYVADVETPDVTWLRALSVPTLPTPPVAQQQEVTTDPEAYTQPETPQLDKWYQQLNLPRIDPRLVSEGVFAYIADVEAPDVTWLRAFDEPVLPTPPVAQQQAITEDREAYTQPEAPQLDKWYQALSEPTRQTVYPTEFRENRVEVVAAAADTSEDEWPGTVIVQEEPVREVAPFIVVGDFAIGQVADLLTGWRGAFVDPVFARHWHPSLAPAEVRVEVVAGAPDVTDEEFISAYRQFHTPDEFNLEYIPVPDDPNRAQAQQSSSGGVIRLALDSLHADYAGVTGALTVRETLAASHDANIKVVIADDPVERTGSLAPINRDTELGVGVFKDEYVSAEDYDLRAKPLLGEGPFADQVWYVRPRVTYAVGTGTATRVTTYGDGSGRTYGDAFAGPKGYADNKVSVTGTIRLYIVGEHILRLEDAQLDSETLFAITQGGTAAKPSEVRFDYPPFLVNGSLIDGGVLYGGQVVEDAGVSWNSNIVAMPYTETVALVAGDKGLPIVMTVDGDTGTILDFDASTIWIGTDGTADNSFNNDPTSGGAFTITGGTGTGTQDSAATSVSNLYWMPNRPSSNSPRLPWVRDFGSAFGNAVAVNGRKNFTGLQGKATQFTVPDVQTSPGIGAIVTEESTISGAISNEDTFYVVGGTTDPIVVHIINGEDPTSRVMTSSFGPRVDYQGNPSNIHTIGEDVRAFDNTNDVTWPVDNFTYEKFSRCYGDRPFALPIGGWTVDHDNWKIKNGYLSFVPAGFYPNTGAGNNGVKLTNLLVEGLVGEDIAGTNYAESDGHLLGFQEGVDGVTARYIYGRRTGGAINLYQEGNWVASPVMHPYSPVLIEYFDLKDTSTGYPAEGTNSANVGVHLAGDNADEASIGDGKATPPTTKQDVADVTIKHGRVRGFRYNLRDKWRDFKTIWQDIDVDEAVVADIGLIGGDSASADVVVMPYTESTPLVAGDVGKTITMDTDTDTGTIIDYDATSIWIKTDGTGPNSFDNSPTSNDTFTITAGTGAGSQNGAATAEPVRQPRGQFREIEFGGNSTLFWDIPQASAGDYVVDSDENTYHAALTDSLFSSTEFGTQNGTNWKLNSRSGNGSNAEASVFDPNSTWTG